MTAVVQVASFRHDAEFDRYRGIADMAGLAGGPIPSRMTPTRPKGEYQFALRAIETLIISWPPAARPVLGGHPIWLTLGRVVCYHLR